MSFEKQPNPDNRLNNVERLQEMVENTEHKIHEAEISMEFANPKEREQLQQKNDRRKQSIAAMKNEIEDEKSARNNGEI